MQTIPDVDGPTPALAERVVQTHLSFLLGKILTIADSSFSDKEQRKAAKDLIRSAFQEKSLFLYKLAWGGSSCEGRAAKSQDTPLAL